MRNCNSLTQYFCFSLKVYSTFISCLIQYIDHTSYSILLGNTECHLGFFQAGNNTSHSSSGSHSSRTSQNHSGPKMTLDELKEVNKYAESTKSLTYLPQVHERQTERMKTRSEWFLAPSVDCCSCGGSVDMLIGTLDMKTLTTALLRKSSSGTIGKCLNFLVFRVW